MREPSMAAKQSPFADQSWKRTLSRDAVFSLVNDLAYQLSALERL